MQISINGEIREVADGTTVAGLLALLGVKAPRVAVEVNEIAEALQHTSEVWNYLQTNSQGMEFPILAYQTCVDVFNQSGDSEKAAQALQVRFSTLMDRADKISDSTLRKSFLENVPEHRAMMEKWTARRSSIERSE